MPAYLYVRRAGMPPPGHHVAHSSQFAGREVPGAGTSACRHAMLPDVCAAAQLSSIPMMHEAGVWINVSPE